VAPEQQAPDGAAEALSAVPSNHRTQRHDPNAGGLARRVVELLREAAASPAEQRKPTRARLEHRPRRRDPEKSGRP
jgi:hypothetical protein